MTEPRKHHSVPQSTLRRFSIRSEGRSVYAFDKSDRIARVISGRDAGAERDFYKAEFKGRVINFEPAFQQIDASAARILGSLAAEPSPVALSSDEKAELPSLAAVQLLRTKLQRTTPAELMRQLEREATKFGLPVEASLTDADVRRVAIRRILDNEVVERSFREKDMLLLEATGESRFWISDNPVVMYNTLPYGHVGLSAPGIEIYLPISPRRALGFQCPSIAKHIAESLDPNHPRPRLDNPLYPGGAGGRWFKSSRPDFVIQCPVVISAPGHFAASNGAP